MAIDKGNSNRLACACFILLRWKHSSNAGNTAVQYTIGRALYFKTQSFIPQHVQLFVNNTNSGYHPINKNNARPSANANQES